MKQNGHDVDLKAPDVARILSDPALYAKLRAESQKPASNGARPTPKAPVAPREPPKELPETATRDSVFGGTGAPQLFASVEQLDRLAEAIMSTDNMRLRSNLSPQLVVCLVRCMMFDAAYDSPNMRSIIKFILETRTSVKGWGMGNLIKGLQALRPASPMYDQMNADQNGQGSRGLVRRVMGR